MTDDRFFLCICYTRSKREKGGEKVGEQDFSLALSTSLLTFLTPSEKRKAPANLAIPIRHPGATPERSSSAPKGSRYSSGPREASARRRSAAPFEAVEEESPSKKKKPRKRSRNRRRSRQRRSAAPAPPQQPSLRTSSRTSCGTARPPQARRQRAAPLEPRRRWRPARIP